MEFRELIKRYKAGEATPEEMEQVKREIEKYELLSDYVMEQMENEKPGTLLNPPGRAELKAVKRHVSRKIYICIGIVFLLVALAGAGVVTFADKHYYDPNLGYGETYGGDGQFLVDTAAFTELHFPGYVTNWADAERVGVGSYEIRIRQYNWSQNKDDNFTGRIVRGKVVGAPNALEGYWHFPATNYFGYKTGLIAWKDEKGNLQWSQSQDQIDYQVNAIKELPQSSRVSAYVTFRKDLTLEQLAELTGKYKESASLDFAYAAVRSTERGMNVVGFEPSGMGVLIEGKPDQEKYPYFDLANYHAELEKDPAKVWQGHFETLLRYLADRPQFLQVMADVNGIDAAYYQNILAYVKKNGVNIYGVLVLGSAQDVLKFSQEEWVDGIQVSDVKLSVLAH